uniref:type II secretion system minor pseudopilin GspH n=1 Tax=Thaumasiovibrio occultus TaxID=1891184 RepID=UPI000B359155|nr:type II secretion system minor pseudopilin GspH [Thaumasiovibrio occultus]
MKQRNAGFTLIEVMLVVILMAGVATLAVGLIPPSNEDRSQDLSQQLYHRLRLLTEQSVLTGVDYGVRVERHSYQFLQLTRDGWQPLPDNRTFSDTQDDDMILTLEMLGFSWDEQDTLFEPGSLFDEDMFRDEEEEKQLPPQIIVMASGELTPFDIQLTLDEMDEPWRIVGDEVGRLTLLAPGETLDDARE